MNEVVGLARTNRFAAASSKKSETSYVAMEVRRQMGRVPLIAGRCEYAFEWHCKDTRKDPDNIASAKKAILDGLQEAGLIPDDSWRYVAGFSDSFHVDRENPRIVITIKEISEPYGKPRSEKAHRRRG
jgi:Holliday junction resolvase RusA-like endonuclease